MNREMRTLLAEIIIALDDGEPRTCTQIANQTGLPHSAVMSGLHYLLWSEAVDRTWIKKSLEFRFSLPEVQP